MSISAFTPGPNMDENGMLPQGPTVASNQPDSFAHSRSRWEDAREYREPWTREALKDKRTLRGDVFDSYEKEVFRIQERDIPNYNLAHQTIQIVAGIEAQNRSDLKFLPMHPDDIDGAQALTQLSKKVATANQLDREVSFQFFDAATMGIGWSEVRFATDPQADPIYMGHIPSLDVWMDPAGRRMDLEDHTDIHIAKYLRPIQLARIFPAFAQEIMQLKGEDMSMHDMSHTADYTNSHSDYPDVSNEDEWNGHGAYGQNQNGRARVLQAVERWYRVDEVADFVKYLDGRCIEVPKGNTADNFALRRRMATDTIDGKAHSLRGTIRRIRYAVFCGDLLLGDYPSPFSHRRFPLVPMWAYQDEHGRPMGMVRLLRTPAKDFNARMAMMLKRNMTRQTYAEDGAFEDDDKAIEEMSMADGFIKLKANGLKKLMFKDDLKGTETDSQMIQIALRMITEMSGVTQSLMGQQSQENSGVAINAKINQGQTGLFTLFDNRNWTVKRLGELQLSGIQDKYTREMAIRTTESSKGVDFIFINKKDPLTGAVLNDVTQAQFDVTVSEIPASASDRMAQFQALTTFLAPMPMEVKMVFASKLAALADIPDAVEVAAEIDKLRAQMSAPAQGQQQPKQSIVDKIDMKLPDFTPEERVQVLAEVGVKSDAAGPQGAPVNQPPPQQEPPPGPGGPPQPPNGPPTSGGPSPSAPQPAVSGGQGG
jgi:hypothetical protein